MTGLVLTAICLTLFVLLFVLSLGCYSLTAFSRTRLDEVCEKAGHEARFLEILRGWERAAISVDTLRVMVVVAIAASAIVAWDLIPSRASSRASNETAASTSGEASSNSGESTSPATIPDEENSAADPATKNDSAAAAAAWFNTFMKWLVLFLALVATGIILPRAYARTTGERFLVKSWPAIQTAILLVKPITKAALWVDKVLHRLYDLDEPNPDDPDQLAEEIRTIADAGERTGALDAHASLMIDQVMDLKDADVASVMTPRTEMNYIRADLPIEEARQAILEVGHTRMPMIGKSTDDIVGILYAKDLLRYTEQTNEAPPSLSEICRKPFFVPETTSVDRLLQTMKRKRVHLAIVLDEYGGVAGLVTMEDLLEEIVGDIDDEYDNAEPDPIERVSPTVNELDARVHIDDLVEEFDYDLPEDRDRDYDTIGGFVVAHLGHIPERDESFAWRNLKVTVLDCDERRVLKVRIEHDEAAAHQNVDE